MAGRNQSEPEYELFDALRDAFLANRYFDVEIEYAKAGSEDLLCRITATNRGPDAAPLHVLPHVWYRNTWSWEDGQPRAVIEAIGPGAARTTHPLSGDRWWYAQVSDKQSVELLFTDNDTNYSRLDKVPNRTQYVKDGINDCVVGGKPECVNHQRGSKLAGHAHAIVPAGGTLTIKVRFAPKSLNDPFAGFDATFSSRIAEADAFYAAVNPPRLTEDESNVVRQAFAGLLWSKQYYHYDVYRWLKGDPAQPTPPEERWHGRNSRWKELHNADVILMPDTWEYPWYAAWDLSFHCVAIAWIDPAFAKRQLLSMGREWYQHASGQYPAYEWDFDDVNPPVIGWAAWRVYQIEMEQTGRGDVDFLKEMFQNEMLCFSFWVNRKDASGRDLFGGGFLGMDNIGCFDRDKTLPNGALLEQSDGTSWMALFCITMLSIAVELARHEPFYQNMALKYFEHFLYIAHAMTNMDGEGIDLWDAEDEFFYDVIHLTNGQNIPLKLHSMVGLVPLFAVLAAPSPKSDKLPSFAEQAKWFLQHRPDLLQNVAPVGTPGKDNLQLLAILSRDRLVAVLRRMLDSEEFLSDYGVRALSRYHLEHPYVFNAGGQKVLSQVPAGRIGQPPVRRQLELARANLVPGQLYARSLAPRVLALLRRHTESRMPHRIGQDVQLERSGRRAHAPLEPDLSARPGTWQPPRGVRRQRLLPERSALARPHTVSRILQRRQRRGARRQPSDRLDRANRVAAVRVRGAKGRCLAPPPGDRIRLALRFAPRVFTSASIRNMPPRSSSCCSTMKPMPTRPTSSASTPRKTAPGTTGTSRFTASVRVRFTAIGFMDRTIQARGCGSMATSCSSILTRWPSPTPRTTSGQRRCGRVTTQLRLLSVPSSTRGFMIGRETRRSSGHLPTP